MHTLPNRESYDPSQLLRFSRVKSFRCDNKDIVAKILSVIADPNVPTEEKPAKIEELVDLANQVSFATALECLHSVASIGGEFEGGCDGLDALCYHLSMHSVSQGEDALRMIRQRLGEWSRFEQDRRDTERVKQNQINSKKRRATIRILETPESPNHTVRAKVLDWLGPDDHEVGILPYQFRNLEPPKEGDRYIAMAYLEARSDNELSAYPIIGKCST